MIGLILAAGKGSRLGNLTMNTPKSLLPLRNGFTLLDYNIHFLRKYGVRDILVVTGFGSVEIEKHVNGLNITKIYNPFWNHCNVLGSLYMSLPYIQDDFVFLHADTLVDPEVLNELIKHKGEIVLPYKIKKCGEEEMKIKLDSSGRIVEISKGMNPSDAIGEFLGIAKFNQSVIPFFKDVGEDLLKSEGLNLYMEAVLQVAIEKGMDIDLLNIEEKNFVEVDFPSDYEIAKNLFSSIL